MAALAVSFTGSPRQGVWRQSISYIQDGTLVVLASFFFYAHVEHLLSGGTPTSVFFALEQALLIVLLLCRRRAQTTSTHPTDWAFATIGSWLPLALQPSDTMSAGAEFAGTAVQMVGLTFTCYAFLTLGRSFGIVAADRGLKVRGPYGVVRHPVYLSHTITMTGFIVANGGTTNAVMLVVIMVAQLMRIRAEERVLRQTADYDGYAAKVRWRLVPGLY